MFQDTRRPFAIFTDSSSFGQITVILGIRSLSVKFRNEGRELSKTPSSWRV